MAETILTRHPQRGKTGRRIDRVVYDLCRQAIRDVLREAGGEATHTELFNRLQGKLSGKIQGSISWYGETVKLDLEARRIISRSHGSPQRIRLLKR